MGGKYLICETTREDRLKLAKDSLAIGIIDSQEPSDMAKELIDRYIDGELEISEIKSMIIQHYMQLQQA